MDEIIIEPVVSEARATAAVHPPSAAPHHVYLIDGSGFIFRAYFARAKDPKAERFQRQSDGMATEVVMHFSNMLDKYLRDTDADHIAVIFDASGRSFRNEIYEQYKANRREMPDDLAPQLAHVRQAADAFGVCRIEMEGFEADDLIATYARHAIEAGAKVTILSSDKDMMQLVSDDRVMMRDPMTDRPIGETEVREKFGVGPDKVIDVQALCGDSTDNVPGVPGIGVKTAAELINAYGDLETLLAHTGEIKQPKRRETLIENEAKARLSKELVKLDAKVPLPCPLSALKVKPYDPEKLFPFLDEMELRALKSRIARRLDITAPIPTGPMEPVIPEIPPFTAPRTYALVDTVAGLDHWVEAAQQGGRSRFGWRGPASQARARPCAALRWRWRPVWPLMYRWATVRMKPKRPPCHSWTGRSNLRPSPAMRERVLTPGSQSGGRRVRVNLLWNSQSSGFDRCSRTPGFSRSATTSRPPPIFCRGTVSRSRPMTARC